MQTCGPCFTPALLVRFPRTYGGSQVRTHKQKTQKKKKKTPSVTATMSWENGHLLTML